MAETVEQTESAEKEQPRKEVNLNGKFSFKIDSKGRVTLPAKFRKVLSKDLVVSLNLKEECLYVFETPDFEAWIDRLFVERFGGYQESNDMQARMLRKLKSRANDVEVDASGRIVLPAEVRKAAGIDKDVVVIGSKGRFEIWDAKRYEQDDAGIDLTLFLS